MKIQVGFILSIVLIISLFACSNPSVNEEKINNNSVVKEISYTNKNDSLLFEKEALKSASEWIKLLDNKEYNKNWEVSSPILKMTISKEDWAKNMDILRTNEGIMIERKIIEKTFYTELDQLPKGRHFVFRFETTYEKMDPLIESLTVTEIGGSWKVVGFFVKPKQ